jgi:regulatory protein
MPRSKFGSTVAQTWHMAQSFHASPRRKPVPLDGERLRALALAYVGRYATSRAKLAAYLHRKLAVAGWEGEGDPPVDAIVERCAELGYIDDAAYATAKGAALARRGFGERRVGEALRAAGIATEDASAARKNARDQALRNALVYARRRKIGPFSAHPADPAQRRRNLAAMMRAGHPLDIARRVISAAPGEDIDTD